jgi:hypothetical protein
MNRQLGYASPADLTNLYLQFYWNRISLQIQTAIRHINVTSSGRQWIVNLYNSVFRAEREFILCGPPRNCTTPGIQFQSACISLLPAIRPEFRGKRASIPPNLDAYLKAPICAPDHVPLWLRQLYVRL